MAISSFTTDSPPSSNQALGGGCAPGLSVAALSQAVGRRVGARRRALGLSQEELGWRAGLHRTRISQIERGVGCPKISTLYRLALALGVSLDGLCPA
ncbi:helix-turn-helix domain-containing protein, partial [cf. Phormidesmis sp. LEGE 11477]|uniref:helix-turn-helix domain-containing protein n=1 Tax=cf. Phormidesmis sp. LEGE 11477 TaxID=1828680 RepID=UPI001882FD9D